MPGSEAFASRTAPELPASGRAAVMVAAGAPMELREYPLPEPGPGELLVRVRCCTICKSDLHTWTGHRPGPTPAILGHEIVGEIVRAGTGVSHDSGDQAITLGDRITWTIIDTCGKCYYCREAGLPMKCRHLRKYGHDACDAPPHFTGGFAEYCLVGAGTCVVKLPDSVPDEVAATANCALATVIAGWEAADLRSLEHALIQGAGGLGCYAAAVARQAGCQRVIVADVDEDRLQRARRFGATDVVRLEPDGVGALAEAVRSLTRDRGADCALEVAGIPAAIPEGLAALRKGGRYVELGCSFPGADFTVDASLLLWNLLTLRGIHNYDTRHLQQAVDFLATGAGRFPFHELVTHRFPLDQIDAALQCALSGAGLRVAVMP